jgi:uncharacterized membrane protein HdeD (DUF308 family)
MPKRNNSIQMIWGALLLLAGLGVFYRIPQVMPKIEQIEQFSSSIFFIRFCFYLIGILLIGGGIKKVYSNYRKSDKAESTNTQEKKQG